MGLGLEAPPNIYRPQTKFAKVVFTGVCLSMGGGGVRGMHAPQAHMHTPPGHTCSPGYACPQAHTAPQAGTPPRRVLRDALNEWAVRILLECILV